MLILDLPMGEITQTHRKVEKEAPENSTISANNLIKGTDGACALNITTDWSTWQMWCLSKMTLACTPCDMSSSLCQSAKTVTGLIRGTVFPWQQSNGIGVRGHWQGTLRLQCIYYACMDSKSTKSERSYRFYQLFSISEKEDCYWSIKTLELGCVS